MTQLAKIIDTKGLTTSSKSFYDLYPSVESEKIINETSERSDYSLNNLDSKISRFEKRVLEFEGGNEGLAVKSLQNAQFLIIKALLKKGENIVTYNSRHLVEQSKKTYHKLGIDIRIANEINTHNFKKLVDDNTKLIYLETIGTEGSRIPDFQKIINFAKEREIPVLVDNTAGGVGYIFKPISYGANLVIQNTEAWPGFENFDIGTIIIDAGNFNWKKRRHLTVPPEYNRDKNYSLIELIRNESHRYNNFNLLLNSQFLLNQLNGLSVQFQKQFDETQKLSKWLKEQNLVQDVHYTGSANHPDFFQALKFFKNGFGNELSFSIIGGKKGINLFKKYLIENTVEGAAFKEESNKIKVVLKSGNFENTRLFLSKIFVNVQKELGKNYIVYEKFLQSKEYAFSLFEEFYKQNSFESLLKISKL